jgi:hypothetical protein
MERFSSKSIREASGVDCGPYVTYVRNVRRGGKQATGEAARVPAKLADASAAEVFQAGLSPRC